MINQASRKIAKYYTNYDLLYNALNELVKPKGINLLNYLTSVIENSNSDVKNIDTNTTEEKMCLISSILTNEKKTI